MELAGKYSVGNGVPVNKSRASDLCRRALEKLSPNDIDDISEFINRHVENERERECLWVTYSKKVVEQSGITEWEEDGEIEWGFDESIGRLIIKGKGPQEDYADGTKTCKMKDYKWDEKSPWQERYKEQIKSVVICYGISAIGNFTFHHCSSI